MDEVHNLLQTSRLDQILQEEQDIDVDLEESLGGDDFIPADAYSQNSRLSGDGLIGKGSRAPATLFLLILNSLSSGFRWVLNQFGLGKSSEELRRSKLAHRPELHASLVSKPHWIVDFVSNRRWLATLLWVLGGGIIGVAAAVLVNCTLIEITINGFFAMHFGILFAIVAVLLLWNNVGGLTSNPVSELPLEARSKGTMIVRGFGILLLISSLLCFVPDQSWWAEESWNWVQKIPLYSLLGASSCFVLIFAVMDILNLALNVIRTEAQLYFLAFGSALAGLLFGTVFAIVDVEDAQTPVEMQRALVTSEAFGFPIGLVLGAISGRINQALLANS